MRVRVLIDRRITKGREKEALGLILEMRAAATKQPGHISGETLEDSQDSGSIMIVSTWHALGDWRRWESSREHQGLVSQIEPLLEEPAKVRICVNPWDALMTD